MFRVNTFWDNHADTHVEYRQMNQTGYYFYIFGMC